MDRRTIVLGMAAAGAVTAAVVVTVAGSGKTTSTAHAAVAGYIKDVDRIEQRMQAPLTRALTAFRTFSAHGARSRSEEAQLAKAESTLRRLRSRLAVMSAPPQAIRLHTRILDLIDAEVAVAHEIVGLARFMPRFTALVARSRSASSALAKALAAVKAPTAHRLRGTRKQIAAAQAAFAAASRQAAGRQADAVDAYDDAVAVAVHRLRRLRPPEVMAPAYRSQLRALAASRTAGTTLSQELRKNVRSHGAVLARRFTEATRSAGSVNAQRAQIAAVKAYNASVQAISELSKRVQDEVARLQRTLP
jgi:hypothetical protein